MTGSTATEELLRDIDGSKASQQAYDSYRGRLMTFKSTTWFAMPLPLAPPVVALSGWRNVGLNLLECEYCRRKWTVVYNDTLSKESRDKLTHIYAQKLATAHSDICVHRNKAKGYLEHDTTTNRLPILLLSSLPAPEAHLLEHLEPVALFSQRAQSVLEVTRTLTLTLEFSPGMEAVWDALLDKIRPPPNVHAECWHTALQLALLGWQPVEDDTKSCECRLCLARLPLTDSSSKGFRKRRRRVLHPVDQHKYYCPYVVGIVGHVPLWKWLAVRLLGAESVKHDTEGNDQDKAPRPTAWEQVHRFLGRALSRHRK